MQLAEELKTISTAFLRARESNRVLDDYPGAMPTDLKTAYLIQDAAIAAATDLVGGWKVGRIPPHLVDHYGCERLAGPVFTSQIVEASAEGAVAMPVLSGFAAAEAEIALRIGTAPVGPLTLESAREVVDAVRFSIEIASSPFAQINDHGPAVTVSDFGNNYGLLLGPHIENWREIDLFHVPVSLEIDGDIAGTGVLANMLDGPFGALVFLNTLLQARGMPLKPGDWVSTGAITGVHRVTAQQSVVARFGDAYSVACDIAPFTAA